MQRTFTVPEKILVCASELDQKHGTFTAEDLVVRCWERFPETFGLQGYANKYPDSNRILTNIMGGKGVRGKGWLRKTGEKRYRITETGKQAASALESTAAHRLPEQRAASIARPIIDILIRLVESRAIQKYRLNEDLTFGDLCSFWNISARSNAYQLNVALKDTESALLAAEEFIQAKSLESLILPGRAVPITKGELAMARSLHQDLKERFWHELDVIRERDDERLRR